MMNDYILSCERSVLITSPPVFSSQRDIVIVSFIPYELKKQESLTYF